MNFESLMLLPLLELKGRVFPFHAWSPPECKLRASNHNSLAEAAHISIIFPNSPEEVSRGFGG